MKECVRTEVANSRWFDDLLMTGQFYNPLTKLKGIQRPRSNKDISVSEADSTIAAAPVNDNTTNFNQYVAGTSKQTTNRVSNRS